MKSFNMFVVLSIFLAVGHAQDVQQEMLSFGADFKLSGTITGQEMSDRYGSMHVLDTLQTKFRGVVKEVCQAKGCWMKVALEDGKEAMVRFKDYGFFMPKDIAGKEVIVNGLAFIEEMGVDDQRHYAEDAGKSPAEIAKITKPKRTLGFTADGVILQD